MAEPRSFLESHSNAAEREGKNPGGEEALPTVRLTPRFFLTRPMRTMMKPMRSGVSTAQAFAEEFEEKFHHFRPAHFSPKWIYSTHATRPVRE